MSGKGDQSRLEIATSKWWFLAGIVVLNFLLPPITTKNFNLAEWGNITSAILSEALIYDLSPAVYALFKVIPVVLIAVVLSSRLGDIGGKVFDVYAGLSYVTFAIVQNVAILPDYGVGIVTINMLMMGIVAFYWLRDAAVGKNDFSRRPASPSAGIRMLIALAALAFLYPIDLDTANPNFSPLNLLTNPAGLTFCMMTPVYLAVLILQYPSVSETVLRVTSFIGLIIGLYNLAANFFAEFDRMWWNGALHIPLLVLAICGLVLSFRPETSALATNKDMKGRP